MESIEEKARKDLPYSFDIGCPENEEVHKCIMEFVNEYVNKTASTDNADSGNSCVADLHGEDSFNNDFRKTIEE